MNKEECSADCVRLQAFQAAILHNEEFSIKEFGVKASLLKT